MSLIELYASGSNDDIALFNLLFFYYAIVIVALIFGLFKFTKQNVSVLRFVSGIIVFYIGSLVVFGISFDLIIHFNQQIGKYASGPGLALLLLLMGFALGGTLIFAALQKLLFKVKDIKKITIGFVAAQPVLAIVFFIILMVSGI